MPKKVIQPKVPSGSSTKGTKLAAEIREKANSMSEAERTEALHRGLSLIYAKGKKLESHADSH